MPRTGQNPMRWASQIAAPAPLTVATMVHIPELHGYWTESLEVLELSLTSLLQTTPRPFELVVLDNGSCTEVRQRLLQRYAAGEIDHLLLSQRNLGKVGGWNLLFAAARGEKVAYFDSDVYFLPGWFEASHAVLEAFPEAAMVTALPIAGDLSLHCEATLAGAAADSTVEQREGDDLIPQHFLESHRRSLGEAPEQYAARLQLRREVRLRRGEMAAYVSASHFQFLSRCEILKRFFPLPTHIPLGDDVELDEQLDKAGYWRLSTIDYLVHHLGNRSPDLGNELPWLYFGEAPEISASPPARWKARLAESPRFRRLLKTFHRKSYELLYPG